MSLEDLKRKEETARMAKLCTTIGNEALDYLNNLFSDRKCTIFDTFNLMSTIYYNIVKTAQIEILRHAGPVEAEKCRTMILNSIKNLYAFVSDDQLAQISDKQSHDALDDMAEVDNMINELKEAINNTANKENHEKGQKSTKEKSIKESRKEKRSEEASKEEGDSERTS